MKSKDTIALGWIDPGVVDGHFALSMMNIYARRTSRIGQILRTEGGLISRMRNEIVVAFLDGPCDWLLMIDSDERLSVEDFDKLITAAHATERPFVGGLYFGAFPNGPDIYPQPVPLIFTHAGDTSQYLPMNDYPPNQLIDVAAAGTGCLLVHRSVFEAIRDQRGNAHQAGRWCWFMDMPVNGEWLGEDMYFCRLVESVGVRMVVHTGVVLGHRKRYWLDASHHERYKLLTRRDDADDAG